MWPHPRSGSPITPSTLLDAELVPRDAAAFPLTQVSPTPGYRPATAQGLLGTGLQGRRWAAGEI